MEELELLAAELQIGESRNSLRCPFCDGGSSRERTFNVTLTEEGLKYKCHRASCAKSGCFTGIREAGAGHGVPSGVGAKRISSASKPTPSLESVPQHIQELLFGQYGLRETHTQRAGLRWAPELNRLWIPVINHDGSHSGAQARSLEAGVVPKTVTYKSSDDWLSLAYYTRRREGLLLVVEDCFSAIRASEYIDSAALLGTHLSWEKLENILEVYDGIVLALDQDATAKAVEYEKRFSPFCHIYILSLERDLKNLTEDELKDKLREYTDDL